MEEEIKKLYEIINDSKRIVFFSGAGVSVSSGIPDFRGEHGIYKYAPEEMISHHFFLEHTKEFFDFYLKHLVFLDANENECHKAIAYLEKVGKVEAVVTQNIDGLHQKAGSKKVIELHGSIHRNHCMKCHKFYDIKDMNFTPIPYCSCGGIIKCHAFYDEKFILESKGVPTCTKCGGRVKPDVVLYEESLNEEDITNTIRAISSCDTLIVIGTSLSVYPAASFIDFFRGKHLVVINLGQTRNRVDAELIIDGKVEDYLNMENIRKYLKKWVSVVLTHFL